MGVNCQIILPNNVRIRDVAKVMAKLAGNESRLEQLGRDSIVCNVEHFNVTARMAEMAEIRFDAPIRKEETQAYVGYHFEHEQDGRLLAPKATAFWIAMGKALVDFFGGALVYHDMGNKRPNYKKPAKSRAINAPSDGIAWRKFQERIHAVAALTETEISAAKEHASY